MKQIAKIIYTDTGSFLSLIIPLFLLAFAVAPMVIGDFSVSRSFGRTTEFNADSAAFFVISLALVTPVCFLNLVRRVRMILTALSGKTTIATEVYHKRVKDRLTFTYVFDVDGKTYTVKNTVFAFAIQNQLKALESSSEIQISYNPKQPSKACITAIYSV